jgi:hypothetical protein
MLGFTLKVEMIAGMSIQDAARDLVAMAKKLDCAVEARFNYVHVVAFPNDDAADLAAAYWHENETATLENPGVAHAAAARVRRQKRGVQP